MKPAISAKFLMLLLLVILLSPAGCKKDNSPEEIQEVKPEDTSGIYEELRGNIFSLSPESIGIDVIENDSPYCVVMDIAYPEGVATLVSFIDGNASLYFSRGGGVIGGIAHKTVADASMGLVKEANVYISQLKKTEQFPVPEAGFVRFYLLTAEGVYTAQEVEEELLEDGNNLAGLFSAAQAVITELRMISDD